ncbi:MAG TPA: hypothetical protein VJC15_03650 [Candidatus Paceibacterota bacterium]
MTSAALEPVLNWLLANGVKPDSARSAVSRLTSLWDSYLSGWPTLLEIGIAGSKTKSPKSVPHIWLYLLWSATFHFQSKSGINTYRNLQKLLAEEVGNPLLPNVAVRVNVFSAQDMSPETFEASLQQICNHSNEHCLGFLRKTAAAPPSS